MEIDKYVEKYQPILKRTFSNALISKKIPQAFLLSGFPGIPLKEIAIYMAKSLVCDNPNPLADLTCNVCKRIDSNSYPDLAVFDGGTGSIKKEQINEIISAFSKTALEEKGRMIYIIHLVETMNDESINALLKFLEEPAENTFAILTTENDSKVLPTIISRCQTIRLTLRKPEDVENEALSMDVKEDDAEILSNLFNDPTLVKEMSESEDYVNSKEAFDDVLPLLNDKGAAKFSIENVAITKVKGKPATRLFFDMITLALSDATSLKKGNQIKLKSYYNIISSLTSLSNAEKALKDVMVLRRKVETNIHGGLLLVHLIHIICED